MGLTDFIDSRHCEKPVHEVWPWLYQEITDWIKLPIVIYNRIFWKQVIREICNGGVDYSFECVGNMEVLRQAFLSTHDVRDSHPTNSRIEYPFYWKGEPAVAVCKSNLLLGEYIIHRMNKYQRHVHSSSKRERVVAQYPKMVMICLVCFYLYSVDISYKTNICSTDKFSHN